MSSVSEVITIFVRPIPPIMMPHTVQLQSYSGSSRYGESYADPVTITHVRVVPKSQLKTQLTFGFNAETIDFASMLFIDVSTSKQITDGAEQDLKIVPKEKDKVIFKGKEYVIQSADELLAGDKVHHYECGLNGV
ncbi:hypothetical protein I6J17_07970 [Heyndrickxia coagulans]|nr:minor capsid protein [Heyndrickxia coagulans]QJE33865.1 hypothetical protein HHU11_15450 [Heyndrickxia coagulans]QQS93800.1 hypothetical protein I6J17_07970 [Heyndrickxia coagulans]